jgi:hypothetical protein
MFTIVKSQAQTFSALPIVRHVQRLEESLEASFPFYTIFGLFGFLWAAAFWPALHDAWWYADDLWAGEWTSAQRWGAFTLGDGRPLLGLWSYSFCLDNRADDYLANILLRWAQGAVHVLNATLLARLLWQVMRSSTAMLAILPFLLWPFNADSVMWRAGSFYAIAALPALLGLTAIRINGTPRDHWYWILGSILCGSSMLALQTSAFASITAWTIVVAATVAKDERVPWRQLGREGLLVVAGLGLGAAISLWLIRTYPHEPGYIFARTRLATDIGAKLSFVAQLNLRLLTSPEFYPSWLRFTHVALGLVTILCVVALPWLTRSGHEVSRRWGTMLACVVAWLILPYAAQLVVAESIFWLRTLYLAPLVFTACFVVLFTPQSHHESFSGVAAIFLLIIVCSYVPIARQHASEYVTSYQRDVAQLRRIEDLADQTGLNRVIVVPGTPFHRYNPYHLRYVFFYTHNSLLAIPFGMRETFIRTRSHLQPVCQAKDMIVLQRGDVDTDKAILTRALAQRAKLRVGADEPVCQKIDGYNVLGIFLP